MKVERSWILTGQIDYPFWWGKKRKETRGEPSSVNFNHKYVLRREEQQGDLVGFLHTHPGMPASPSQRDHDTMHQWVLSFGKPLICAIMGIDGLKAYCYIDDEHPPEYCEKVKLLGNNFIAGTIMGAGVLNLVDREQQKEVYNQMYEDMKVANVVRAKELVPGAEYQDAKTGKIIEFSRMSKSGWAIVHPPGEPDMQSCFGVNPVEVLEVLPK